MNTEADFIFPYVPSMQESFRNGTLVREWARKYPELFDGDDMRILGTEHQRKYHFFEWLSAVVLYETTGFLGLMEKYTAKAHPRKLGVFSNMVSSDLFEFVMRSQSGLPDLFSFHPDTGEWFFSEVKGGADTLKENQREKMMQLFERTGKKVRIIHVNEVKP